MLHHLTGWLAGVVRWRKGCVEGGVWRKRGGQGCFLLSQLIDSQMSGGVVVFFAAAEAPGDTFPLHKQT